MVNAPHVGIEKFREEHMATAHQIQYLYGTFSIMLIILLGVTAWGMIALA